MELFLWSSAGQAAAAAVATVIVYLFVLAAVRLVGRRTTAQISAYDVLVTVALGTSLATTSLPAEPAVVDGLVVLTTLLVLQITIGAARQRFPLVGRLTDFKPRAVVRHGELCHDSSVFGAQLTREEILAELRRHGVPSTRSVTVMILEPTGQFSVRTAPGEEPGEPWEAI